MQIAPNVNKSKIIFQRLVFFVNRNVSTKFIENIIVAIKVPSDDDCIGRNKKFVERIKENLSLCKISGGVNIN